MKKLLVWVGMLLLPTMTCCASQKFGGARAPGNASFVGNLEQQTVALVHFRDSNTGKEVDPDQAADADLVPYCTGVWVGTDAILTAEHCVDGIGKPVDAPTTALQSLLDALEHHPSAPVPNTEWTPVGQPVAYSTRNDVSEHHKAYNHGKVVAVSMYDDLALIRVQIPGTHPVAHLAPAVPDDGTQLHIVGHPAGMWWTYIRGYVSAHHTEETNNDGKKHDMLQVSAPVFFGNSGGPAFDDDGDLVGTADSIRRDVPNVSFFVCTDVVRAFLQHNRVIA